jgi:hypothetical protein
MIVHRSYVGWASPCQPRVFAGALCIAVVLPALISAQNPADSRDSTISGTVINSVTQSPISRALVSTSDERCAAFTDSAGHFELNLGKQRAVPSAAPGQISAPVDGQERVPVTARKPGFLPIAESGASASPGEELTISLVPEAIIVGRVTFSTPDTTAHVTVQLFFQQIQDGLPRWAPRGSASTNLAGEFRFADLPPGTYKLGTNEALDNDPGQMLSRNQVYGFPPVYYPGAPDFATAGEIGLAAGQTVQADFSLTRQPYYSVRIPVNGDLGGGMNLQVSLHGHRGPGYSLGINDGEHRIEGLLPNGNYVVDARTYGPNSASGTANLKVAGGPADGTPLTMVPGSGISLNVKGELTSESESNSGTVQIYSGPLAGRQPRSSPVRGPRAYLSANLEPVDDFVQGGHGTIRPPLGPNDDSMVLTGVPAGRYWLRLYPFHGYVAAATMGATDALHQPITIANGSAGSVEITMRDDFASVEGTVMGDPKSKTNRRDSPNVFIYFVPLPESAGQFQQIGVAPDEAFNLPNIVPGSYRVLAFSHAQQNLPYRDSQAMKMYETKGQVIHLTAGQIAHLQLQVISEE